MASVILRRLQKISVTCASETMARLHNATGLGPCDNHMTTPLDSVMTAVVSTLTLQFDISISSDNECMGSESVSCHTAQQREEEEEEEEE